MILQLCMYLFTKVYSVANNAGVREGGRKGGSLGGGMGVAAGGGLVWLGGGGGGEVRWVGEMWGWVQWGNTHAHVSMANDESC